MSKHTPGPWFISRDERDGMSWNNHIASVPDPKSEICAMFHDGTPNNEIGEANAILIAAAPDLLKALKQIVSDWEDGEPEDIVDACAAIAKAEGREP
jgi:hypothetical protein